MKNFDLNAYGVSEMKNAEMMETHGGGILADALGFICGIAGRLIYDDSQVWYGGDNPYYCPLR